MDKKDKEIKIFPIISASHTASSVPLIPSFRSLMDTKVISVVENTIQAFDIKNKDIFLIGFYFLWQNMELKLSHKVAFNMELIKHA